MKSKVLKMLKIEELHCVFSCIREAREYMEANNEKHLKHIGVSCAFAETCRVAVSKEMRSRPNHMDDYKPWVYSPSLSDMSNEAISYLTTKELLCFSNCIAATLEYLDDEDQFSTRVGGPTIFARVFKSALDLELANRSANSDG